MTGPRPIRRAFGSVPQSLLRLPLPNSLHRPHRLLPQRCCLPDLGLDFLEIVLSDLLFLEALQSSSERRLDRRLDLRDCFVQSGHFTSCRTGAKSRLRCVYLSSWTQEVSFRGQFLSFQSFKSFWSDAVGLIGVGFGGRLPALFCDLFCKLLFLPLLPLIPLLL